MMVDYIVVELKKTINDVYQWNIKWEPLDVCYIDQQFDGGSFWKRLYKVVPQFGIAKLVPITPITMVYGRYNYSIHGVYKPTNITGGHHPVGSTNIDG